MCSFGSTGAHLANSEIWILKQCITEATQSVVESVAFHHPCEL